MREQFVQTVSQLVDLEPRTAVVLADIYVDRFAGLARRHPDRVVNVGIREQAMIGTAAGMALAGLRPFVHSYGSFLVERPFEQVKLDLSHQDLGAVLVSIGASYDWTGGGYTHHSPGDVALLDTPDGWTVHVPGHPDEVDRVLRAAASGDGRVYVRLSQQTNAQPYTGAGLQVLRRGSGLTVVAVGPLLDPVLAATDGLDVTVLYAGTVRPFDGETLRAVLAEPAVVLVEPYLRGTSARFVADALVDVPHRLLALGVPQHTARIYGSPIDHDVAYGLDPASLRAKITQFR